VAMTWITRCGFPIRRPARSCLPSLFRDVNVKVSNASLMKPVEKSIHAVLIRSHGEKTSTSATCGLINTANQTQNTFTNLLGAVAVISLIVGGIGVMTSCWCP